MICPNNVVLHWTYVISQFIHREVIFVWNWLVFELWLAAASSSFRIDWQCGYIAMVTIHNASFNFFQNICVMHVILENFGYPNNINLHKFLHDFFFKIKWMFARFSGNMLEILKWLKTLQNDIQLCIFFLDDTPCNSAKIFLC